MSKRSELKDQRIEEQLQVNPEELLKIHPYKMSPAPTATPTSFGKKVLSYSTYFIPSHWPYQVAQIFMNCEDGYTFCVIFQRGPVSTNAYTPAVKVGQAYADIGEYPYYVDLLRNAPKVMVWFNLTAPPPMFTVWADWTK